MTFKLLCIVVTGCHFKPKNCLVRVLLMICAVETLCGEYMICQQFHDVGILKNPLLLKTAEDRANQLND